MNYHYGVLERLFCILLRLKHSVLHPKTGTDIKKSMFVIYQLSLKKSAL